jgi:hypothetical protein
VAWLRVAAARCGDDGRLAALVGELSLKSQEFAALWAAPPKREKWHGRCPVTHPVVGELTLDFEVLNVPDEGYALTTFHAEAGTASEAALRLLASLTATAAGSAGSGGQVTEAGRDPR